ncbi:ABC transporter permease, partial [Salmonella enterica]|nr:ABC transporter permease [Salmonella enterica]
MQNSKLPLIIKREYVTRVRKVSFIVMSLLMPVGMLLLMALPTLIAMIGTTDTSRVAVLDRTARYAQSLTDCQAATYSLLPPDTDEAALRSTYADSGYDAYMVITGRPSERDSVRLYSASTLPAEVKSHTEDDLRAALKKEMMGSYAAHTPELDSLFTAVNEASASVTTITLADDGSESEDFAEVGMRVSLLAAMLIDMFVLTTGAMVMQGVMEEKSNRIIEVLISSVKPFELMMGKILGIALVALTQLAIWIVFGVLAMSLVSIFVAPDALTAGAAGVGGMGGVTDPAVIAA